jgi:hypothetical protein
MHITRGYFYKERGNAVVCVTAQVDYQVSLQVHNNEGTPCTASIDAPISPYLGNNVQGPSNGIGFTVPPTSSKHCGPIFMLSGEQFTLNAGGNRLQVFVMVQTEESDPAVAQIAMSE